MSKRFGRNQRRRMREALAIQAAEIASCKETVGQAKKSARAASEELREAQDFLMQIAEMVGDASVLAGEPCAQLPTHFRDGDALQFLPQQEFRGFEREVCGSETLRLRSEIVRLLRLDNVRSQLDGCLHFRAALAGASAGYAISESALRRMPREMLIQRLSEELAQGLSNALVTQGVRR